MNAGRPRALSISPPCKSNAARADRRLSPCASKVSLRSANISRESAKSRWKTMKSVRKATKSVSGAVLSLRKAASSLRPRRTDLQSPKTAFQDAHRPRNTEIAEGLQDLRTDPICLHHCKRPNAIEFATKATALGANAIEKTSASIAKTAISTANHSEARSANRLGTGLEERVLARFTETTRAAIINRLM